MAIEIRELVVKTTIIKTIQQGDTDFVTKSDMKRFRKDFLDEAMDKVRNILDDIRERR